MRFRLWVLGLCVFSVHNALALDLNSQPHVVGMALNFGGDELASAGNDSLEAGGELTVYYGRIFGVSARGHYQINIGFKDDLVEASNGDVWFYRIPVDLLAFRAAGQYRIGGGITFHLHPRYKIDIVGTKETIDFDNGVGVILQMDVWSAGPVSTGIRYEDITYKSKQALVDPATGALKTRFDGSSFGLFARLHF